MRKQKKGKEAGPIVVSPSRSQRCSHHPHGLVGQRHKADLAILHAMLSAGGHHMQTAARQGFCSLLLHACVLPHHGGLILLPLRDGPAPDPAVSDLRAAASVCRGILHASQLGCCCALFPGQMHSSNGFNKISQSMVAVFLHVLEFLFPLLPLDVSVQGG